ncbi:hypothetical protein RFF73_11455, partial [Streptococcus ruminantium]|nr:hypothetical protein [Streptococcus ruminantium]
IDDITNVCEDYPDDISQQLDQILKCILQSYAVLEVDHKKFFFQRIHKFIIQIPIVLLMVG